LKHINNQKYLIDTDILIDHLRGKTNISSIVGNFTDNICYVSVISVAEIYSFLFTQEYQAVDELLKIMTVINIDALMAKTAGQYRMIYYKSHNLTIPDALIAATAKINGAALITRNIRHFPMDDIKKICP